MSRRLPALLLSLALTAALTGACSKQPAVPAIPEPPLPTALGAPDLTQAKPLVLTRTAPPGPTPDGPPLDIGAVAFLSAERGFGAGFHGAIYATDDGGRRWRRLHQQEGVRFYRLHFAGEQVGWAIGYEGCGKDGEACGGPVVLRTTDGGQNWQATAASGLPAADQTSVWEMQFAVLSADLAYAAAMEGDLPLLRTVDGGRTWNPVPLPDGVRPDGGLFFLTAGQGWVSGSRGEREHVVLATADGGQSWRSIYDGLVPIRSIQFIDEKRGFLGGGFDHWRVGPVSQVLLATEDGGVSWHERSRAEQFIERPALVGLHFQDENRGWAEQRFGPLLRTLDGGRTWTHAIADRFALRPAVLGDRLWFRWGELGHGFLMHTPDGGQSWSALYQRGALRPEHIQFSTPQVGWLATPVGIVKSTDGGESWAPTGLTTPTMLFSVPVFASEQVSLRYAEERGRQMGTLERSEDGGRTYSPVLAEVSLPRLSFVSPTTGYLSARNTKQGPGAPYPDLLMKTTDGGRNWAKLPAELPVHSLLSFADDQHGAAAGGGHPVRRLMVTGDGGQNWLSLELPDLWVRSVSYTRGGHLWLAVVEEQGERRGLLLHSPDRGATWEAFEVEGAGEFMVQVHFSSPADGWLLARIADGPENEPVLARTRDGGKSWQQVWP